MSHAWMPFYVGDYLRDTMHLTTLEHGMYILLLLHYYQHGHLPTDPPLLANITKVSGQCFRNHQETLEQFFEMPGWRHKRVEQELAKIYNIKIKRGLAVRSRKYRPVKGQSKGNHLIESGGFASAKYDNQKPIQSQSKKERGTAEKKPASWKRPSDETREELEARYERKQERIAALYASKSGKG